MCSYTQLKPSNSVEKAKMKLCKINKNEKYKMNILTKITI